jgi:hypothetical protein
MKFSHPLARSGSVWSATTLDDKGYDILVIVTTLELDARHTKFKASKVERLRDAAKQYLREHLPDVREVVLMNPVKG